MGIHSSVLTNEDIPPSIVETNRCEQDVSVVDGMVMSDPCSSETPELLNSGVRAESGSLLLLSL